MDQEKILYIVHCVDTEGPLSESIEATFIRLNDLFDIEIPATKENLLKIQNMQIDFNGKEKAVAECFSPELLEYNSSWEKIDSMLDELLSDEFRFAKTDDFGRGWVFSWHCMDHVGLNSNPRHKDLGYGNVYNHYLGKLDEFSGSDHELNWHFHPLSLTKNPTQAATSYVNNIDILNQIICRRIIDNGWFPVVNRPGFHSERSDSNYFLEQWMPFDYANQFCEELQTQPDTKNGRLGDWRRASPSWRGYSPAHDDYQSAGTCKRTIFRCLNVGTRMRLLRDTHVHEAFAEASDRGYAVLAFADHDWRDIRPDVQYVQELISQIKHQFPDVKVKFSGAEEAAIQVLEISGKEKLQFDAFFIENQLIVELKQGEMFGPQPFLAIKTNDGQYFTDNFDELEHGQKWSYVFDEMTLTTASLNIVGVGSAGRYGGFHVERIGCS